MFGELARSAILYFSAGLVGTYVGLYWPMGLYAAWMAERVTG